MKLYIKQAFLTFLDTYDIYDEKGNPKYYAKCDWTMFLHRLRIYEGNEEIGMVNQVFKWIEPEFEFYLHGEKCGNIVKEITILRPVYHLNYHNWIVKGNLFELDYEVFDSEGNIVMTFSKDIFRLTDQYCMDIVNPEHEKVCMMIALAIDMAICSERG